MKQILIGFGLIAWMLLACHDKAAAQRSKTKCPPAKTTWKSRQERKSLVKFEELKGRQREIARAERKQQQLENNHAEGIVKTERAQQKESARMAKVQRAEQAREQRDLPQRSNYYTTEKVTKMKQAKGTKAIASTDCPH